MTLINIAKHGVGIADQTDGRCDCSQTTMKSTKSAKQKPESIPNGLELVSSEDGTDYLVPEFMVPMAEHVRDVREHKSALKVGRQEGGVSEIQTASYFLLTHFVSRGTQLMHTMRRLHWARSWSRLTRCVQSVYSCVHIFMLLAPGSH